MTTNESIKWSFTKVIERSIISIDWILPLISSLGSIYEPLRANNGPTVRSTERRKSLLRTDIFSATSKAKQVVSSIIFVWFSTSIVWKTPPASLAQNSRSTHWCCCCWSMPQWTCLLLFCFSSVNISNINVCSDDEVFFVDRQWFFPYDNNRYWFEKNIWRGKKQPTFFIAD